MMWTKELSNAMKDNTPHRCPEEAMGIASLLDDLKLRLGITEKNPYVTFCMNWQSLVGPRLYPHIKPIDVHNGTLVVSSDHPTWTAIAQLQSNMIIGRISKKYPSLGIFALHIISR